MLIRSLAELDRIRDECKSMVTKRSAVSAGAAAVPIPGLDIGTDVALLVEMLPAINSKFGLTPQHIEQLDTRSKRLIVVAASGIGSEIIGKFVSRTLVMSLLRKMGVKVATKSITRFIPLVGQAVAATISFGVMKMVGNDHIEDCYQVCRQALLDEAKQSTVIEIGPEDYRHIDSPTHP
ncbi:MAG: hypothetical protein KID05_03210 [Pseudomonas sp.]|uniref:hypothetical protein n=1 Tax=Pseudomonas sp. TaxID=306 RepID=UPI0023561E14|nr:hypothetical protein [Pseudomonas sp.]MBS5838178.1 hypothetical protein [Pseudomonas sp.]